MIAIVEGKAAEISAGQTIQYVAENALFSGADSYSYAIKFPLKGSLRNREIFGNIRRKDVNPEKLRYECELRVGTMVFRGVLAIVGITDEELSCQFLEGRSAQNFDETLDKIYIDEMKGLCYMWSNTKETTAEAAITGKCRDEDGSAIDISEIVYLPWVNNNSDSGEMHNGMMYSGGQYIWKFSSPDEMKQGKTISGQIYLLDLTRKILEKAGYAADLSEWESSLQWRYLLCLNTLPPVWQLPDISCALPHWSVEQYLEEIEHLIGGLFDIDSKGKRVEFRFIPQASGFPVETLEDVEAAYTEDVDAEEKENDFIDARRFAYAFGDSTPERYYSCDWFIRFKKKIRTQMTEYATIEAMTDDLKNRWKLTSTEYIHSRETPLKELFHVKDEDLYFVLRTWDVREVNGKHRYYLYPVPVNEFGSSAGPDAEDDDDVSETAVSIVPGRVDFTEGYDRCLFLSPSEYHEGDDYRDLSEDDETAPVQPLSAWQVETGDTSDKGAYYDKIFVGFWDSTTGWLHEGSPRPMISEADIHPAWWDVSRFPYTLRLNGKKPRLTGIEVIPESEVTYKFLSKRIPDPRAVFLIHSQPYVCKKITVTFTDDGMSERMEGVFYRIRY